MASDLLWRLAFNAIRRLLTTQCMTTCAFECFYGCTGLFISAKGGILKSKSSSTALLRSLLEPANEVAHEINELHHAAIKATDESKPALALWSEKTALRIWIGCGLLLWLLGLVNLITGVASR